jgi:hypothetical protein
LAPPEVKPAGLFEVRLKNSPIPVWRRFVMPMDATLVEMHDAIQATMGWFNNHLWGFNIGQQQAVDFEDRSWDYFDDYQIDAGKLTLRQVFGAAKKIEYDYDFGDNWTHTVTLMEEQEVPSHALLPYFVKGKGRCPPEDVGGVWGFGDFLAAIENPKSAEAKRRLDWYGGPFEPTDINRQMIDWRLRSIWLKPFDGKGVIRQHFQFQ